MIRPQKRLGEILIDDDIITRDQLKRALEQQREGGGFLGQILIEQKAVSQDTLISYLAKQCQIPHLSLLNYRIGEEALAQVPKELCLKHFLIPVDKMGRILTLAMVDPLDTEALEEIKKHCPALRIKPVLCSWEHFQTTIKQVYSHEVSKPEDYEDKYDDSSSYSYSSQIADETVDKSSIVALEDAPTFDEVSLKSSKEDVSESRTITDAHSDDTPSTSTVSPSGVQDITAAIRESLKDVLGDLVAKPKNNVSPDSLSITQAVQQVLAIIAERNEAERKRDVEALSNAVRESITAAISSTRDIQALQPTDIGKIADATLANISGEKGTSTGNVSATKSASTEHHEHLAQIAEAALTSVRQTAQLIEAHTVTENNKEDLLRHRQAKHTSVAPFMSAKGSYNDEMRMEEDDRVREALTSEHPLESLTFDNFFAGEANKFTVKLARAVAENPGGEFNPFFLYGKVGLGKTHLISAIGNASLAMEKEEKARPSWRVGYISASHFARRLMVALADDALELFRDNYCHWDILILDDIQFLGGRIEAQEEFFHIFNVLQQQERQIIIAGDKAPDRLGMLEQRLVSRFAGGIVADLKHPEWETRMTILHYFANKEGISVPEEVLSIIATRVSDDMRKMIGALRKIIAFSRLEGDKISVEEAQKILNHLGADEAA